MPNLKRIVESHSDKFEDNQKLKGLVADLYAREPLKKNIYWALIEEDIISDLRKRTEIGNTTLSQYMSKLSKKRGINKKLAEKAVFEWCDAFGIAYSLEEIDEAKQNQAEMREKRRIEKNKNRDPFYKELDDLFDSLV